MGGQATTQQVDEILSPFLNATDEEEADRLLGQLLTEHAQPIIRQIVTSKLRTGSHRADSGFDAQASEDIIAEVLLNLLNRLREFKADSSGRAVYSFRKYVAVATYNAFYNYLRQKYPNRWRLKNRLRYILTHQKSFALWIADNGERLCGFVNWGGMNLSAGRIDHLRDHPDDLELSGSYRLTDAGNTAQLLAAIFKWSRGPVVFDELVSFIAYLWEVTDRSKKTDSDGYKEFIQGMNSDAEPDFAARVEQRLYLQRLWKEICGLPLSQRRALLLNLRGAQGDDMATLLVHSRITSLRQLAEALAMSVEELAEIWNDLPLDDLTIAQYLGITRQQVITLRSSARRRLSRRMSKLEQGK